MQSLKNNFVNNDIIHGFRQIKNSKTKPETIGWSITMSLALAMLFVVLFRISRQFILNDLIISVTYSSPDTFPDIYICPMKTPPAVIEAAVGNRNASRVRKLLHSIPMLKNFTPHFDSIPNNESTNSTNPDERWEGGDIIAQDLLMTVGKVHLKELDIKHSASFLEIIPWKTSDDVVLSLPGYCARIRTAEGLWPFAALHARHAIVYVKIYNLELLKQSGGVLAAIKYHKDDTVLPEAIPLQPEFSREIYIFARWMSSVAKDTPMEPCSPDWLSREHCFASCLDTYDCPGEACQLYSSRRRQRMSQLCDIRKAEQCMRNILRDEVCRKRCRKPCKQMIFTKRMTKLEVLKYASVYGNTSAQFFIFVMESPHTSLETQEDNSVVFGLYFVYVGGNLGVFFGIYVYGVFTWIFGYQKQRYAAVLTGMCPFILTLSRDYFVEQKTTALLHVSSATDLEKTVFPKIIFGGPVISEQKLRKLLGGISDTFWDEENLRAKDTYDGNSLPYLCDLVTSLHWIGALTHEFNRSMPNFDHHITMLSKRLDNDSYVKKFGYERLFMEATEDPKDLILGVYDQTEAPLNYTARPILGTSGLYFEIEVSRPQTPTFISQGILSFTIQTKRHSEYEYKCRVRRDVRVAMVAETHENLGLAHDYFLYIRSGDTTISVNAVRIVLKPRRIRPCSNSALSTLQCKLHCYATKAPCPCVTLGFGTDIATRGPVYHVGDLCHRLLPLSSAQFCARSAVTSFAAAMTPAPLPVNALDT